MSYQHFMKCLVCDCKETVTEQLGDGTSSEFCFECGMPLKSFVEDLEQSIIGVPDQWNPPPTLDPNGFLETVVVDAKKLSELTDELVSLRAANKLLQAAVEDAINWYGLDGDGISDPTLSKLQTAIDGGALGEAER